MEKVRALVANDPRIYREVIAAALRELRPLVEVVVAEPEGLDREVQRVRPHLVICSQATAIVRGGGCLCWVVLYPDGEDRVEVGAAGMVGGAARLLTGVGVADLLSVVDETELLCRAS
jgi:hypothetical protein